MLENVDSYQQLFDGSEVAIWSEDFSQVCDRLDTLRLNGVTNLRDYLNRHEHVAWELAQLVKVNHVNAATLKLFKAESELAFIASIDKVFGADAINVFVEELCAIWNGDSTFRSEASQQTLEGEELCVILTMPIPSSRQGFSNVPVTMLDITDFKKSEREILRLQKLVSLGALAGGIAHDFNNILTGLLGNIALAQENISSSHPAHKFLERTEGIMGRATRLTRQLLTFAKGGDPVMEEINLTELVEVFTNLELLGSNVRLVLNKGKHHLNAIMDKGQIQQVLSNLIINAKEAMPEGGNLFVSIDVSQNKPARVSDTGKFLKITFRDEGFGIDQKHIDRIFDPYFSTKETGYGLGLATTFSIIEKHGGQITVDSTLGQGATFTLYLPAVKPSSVEKLETPNVKIKQGHENLTDSTRILIMDDNQSVCDLVSEIFSVYGCLVKQANNGEQALVLYQQYLDERRPFDCVIIDLTIPGGMGGKATMEKLLELDPNVRAVVSSGYSDDHVISNFSEYGFKGIATKPYSVSNLRGLIQKIVAD